MKCAHELSTIHSHHIQPETKQTQEECVCCVCLRLTIRICNLLKLCVRVCFFFLSSLCSSLCHFAFRVMWQQTNTLRNVLQGRMLPHNISQGVIISNHSLVLQGVSRATAGNYSCVGFNAEGDGISPPFTLNVLCKSSIHFIYFAYIQVAVHGARTGVHDVMPFVYLSAEWRDEPSVIVLWCACVHCTVYTGHKREKRRWGGWGRERKYSKQHSKCRVCSRSWLDLNSECRPNKSK